MGCVALAFTLADGEQASPCSADCRTYSVLRPRELAAMPWEMGNGSGSQRCRLLTAQQGYGDVLCRPQSLIILGDTHTHTSQAGEVAVPAEVEELCPGQRSLVQGTTR